MAKLTYKRTTEASTITRCCTDIIGPFYIKEKRSKLKRSGAMFVCLASRAVHIEVTHQIDTDSLIQPLRKMIARRENVRLIQSDNGNGSNFLITENELRKAFLKMDNKKINQYLEDKGAD